MGDFKGKRGYEALRISINSRRWEAKDEAIFFKAVDADGDYGFLALSLEDSKKVHADLGALIEEFEALEPAVPTRREWVRALPYGTVFTSGTSLRYVRLDRDWIYSDTQGGLIKIQHQFGDTPNDGTMTELKVVT